MANYQDINNMTKSLQGKKTVDPFQEYIISPTPTAHLWISRGTKQCLTAETESDKRHSILFWITCTALHKAVWNRCDPTKKKKIQVENLKKEKKMNFKCSSCNSFSCPFISVWNEGFIQKQLNSCKTSIYSLYLIYYLPPPAFRELLCVRESSWNLG